MSKTMSFSYYYEQAGKVVFFVEKDLTKHKREEKKEGMKMRKFLVCCFFATTITGDTKCKYLVF